MEWKLHGSCRCMVDAWNLPRSCQEAAWELLGSCAGAGASMQAVKNMLHTPLATSLVLEQPLPCKQPWQHAMEGHGRPWKAMAEALVKPLAHGKHLQARAWASRQQSMGGRHADRQPGLAGSSTWTGHGDDGSHMRQGGHMRPGDSSGQA
jgi:hypothetical protein